MWGKIKSVIIDFFSHGFLKIIPKSKYRTGQILSNLIVYLQYLKHIVVPLIPFSHFLQRAWASRLHSPVLSQSLCSLPTSIYIHFFPYFQCHLFKKQTSTTPWHMNKLMGHVIYEGILGPVSVTHCSRTPSGLSLQSGQNIQLQKRLLKCNPLQSSKRFILNIKC